MSDAKLAVITGANRGLGRSAALALAADDVDVVLTYRSNPAEADEVVAEIGKLGARAIAVRLDIVQVDTFDAFVEDLLATVRSTFGRDTIDYLVNNAGHGTPTNLGSTSVEDVDLLYQVIFRGPYLLTQALAPVIVDGGSVVNVSSLLARSPNTGWSVYGSLKTAVEQLTRYLAVELGPRRIRVNVVAPRPTPTPPTPRPTAAATSPARSSRSAPPSASQRSRAVA